MKTPSLFCVPPDFRKRLTSAVFAGGAFIAVSLLSPSTQRQSVPTVKKFLLPMALVHCTEPPVSLVGTRWSRVSRLLLRDTPPTLVMARNLLWKRSKLPHRLA